MKLSLYDLMQEIRTYAPIDPISLERAKQSNINTTNSRELKNLLNGWMKGSYDEDPQCLAQELEWLIN